METNDYSSHLELFARKITSIRREPCVVQGEKSPGVWGRIMFYTEALRDNPKASCVNQRVVE